MQLPISNSLQVYLSNRIERLFDALNENLYADGTPFAKRLVMVATPPLKSWVMLELADKGGIAAGLEIGTTEEIFRKLLKARSFPKQEELALALEMEIQALLSEIQPHERWLPLIHYVGDDRCKLTSFTFELARLFQKYNLYGRRLGTTWDQDGWQRGLWDRLFSHPPSQEYIKGEFTVDAGESLDVFAVSFLPQVQWDFLKRLSKNITVRTYCLSPCETFWSDLVSDREAIFFNRLHAYEQVDQPLLANFGKIGRVMAKWIEESDLETIELYENNTLHTLLEHLQNDLRSMRDYRESQITLSEDDSLQIHGAPCLIRELEVVQQLLLKIVADKGIEPRDILVMAPDISLYAPFIPSIFDGEFFTPHVSDLRLPALEPLIQTFLHLLYLVQGRWSSKEFLNLIESPFFYKKLKWEPKDIGVIKDWIEQCAIRWGEDAQHCQDLLENDYGSDQKSFSHAPGTWEFAFQRLLAGLIQTSHGEVAPYTYIESTQGELLGELIQLFRSLKRDLDPFRKGVEKTLTAWCNTLTELFNGYLHYQGYEEQAEPFFKIVNSLRSAAAKYDPAKVPFTTILKHIEHAFSQSSTRYKENNLQTVRFCSLLPLRTVPAKVVVLMGMEEDAFPRTEIPLSFDILHNNPESDFCPTKGDLDRFIFLEALLSARQTLLITYQSQNREDFKEQGPSLLVDELLNAISQGYQVKVPHVIHPLNRFDPQYFQKNAQCLNYFERDYQAAKAYLELKTSHRFIQQFPLPTNEKIPLQQIPFEDLKSFIKDPYKAFFNKTLGVYLEDEKESQQEAFIPSPLKFSSLQRKVAVQPLHEILKNAAKEGALPIHSFRHAAEERLKETLRALEHFKIDPEEIVEVEFELPLSAKLIGKLPLVTSAGLLIDKKMNSQNAIEAWPAFLVYLYLKKGSPKLLFLKDRKIFEGEEIDPTIELEKLISYFQGSLKQGSPLHPALVKQILKGEELTLQSGFSNYVKWLQRGMELPLAKGWESQAADLFGKIII